MKEKTGIIAGTVATSVALLTCFLAYALFTPAIHLVLISVSIAVTACVCNAWRALYFSAAVLLLSPVLSRNYFSSGSNFGLSWYLELAGGGVVLTLALWLGKLKVSL